MELKDPARGKQCQHYSFADLRQYYANSKMMGNSFVREQYFTCPICGIDVKESELLYLKEMLVTIKYLNYLMEDPLKNSDPLLMLGED